ncbi:MAG: D-alanine--D-alanine ligase [Candidatus Omnitrophica bacterium]|nr:D-alanine--D-alanine ligase [Candidatus Omnitrophota bacterium]
MPEEQQAISSRVSVSVVMGGPSSEHEISLRSGQGIAAALAARGWPVRSLVISKEGRVEDAVRSAREALQAARPGVVFVALHGPFGEDGAVQQVCEELGLPYTGSDPRASRIGLDKVASRNCFEEAGLRVPASILIERPISADRLRRAVERLAFPVVVKPTNQGSSIGVSLARTAAECEAAVADAARYDARVLIEEFIVGREMTVGVLGDRALPVIEIQPVAATGRSRMFDFAAKYTAGQTQYIVPAQIPSEMAARLQDAGLRAHQAVGCRHVSRADFILAADGTPVILEVNTIPGFTATSLLPKAAACVGLSYEDVCEELIGMALASHLVTAG